MQLTCGECDRPLKFWGCFRCLLVAIVWPMGMLKPNRKLSFS